MEPPGKQIEIHYDEGGFFLVVMRLWNEDIEVLETASDVEAAERLAYQFSLREMPYVAPNRCGNCCRNLPWSLVPWPKDHLCEICLLPEDDKSDCWNCGITIRKGRGNFCGGTCSGEWEYLHRDWGEPIIDDHFDP